MMDQVGEGNRLTITANVVYTLADDRTLLSTGAVP